MDESTIHRVFYWNFLNLNKSKNSVRLDKEVPPIGGIEIYFLQNDKNINEDSLP